MTLRVRCTAYEPGALLRATVDAASLPLCERLCYEARFTPTLDGGTLFTWDVYYDPLPALVRLVPLVRPLAARLLRKTTAALAAHITSRHASHAVSCGRRWPFG